MTDALGIDPSESWRAGQSFLRGHRRLPRRFSSWRLHSGADDCQPVDTHVRLLLDRLFLRRDGLLMVRAHWRLSVVCVGQVYQSFGLLLEQDMVRQIADLGLGIECDLYPFGDVHEEMVALREALGVRGGPPFEGDPYYVERET